jgi:hypothetical protein
VGRVGEGFGETVSGSYGERERRGREAEEIE